jgi:RNA polymerase sigma-70 factor (ECF subfamily)
MSDSFEELAMPLFDSLYNFARWLTQHREEAEDLVQETYAKALKGFRSFQPGTNFRAWIFRIMRNTFLTSRTGLQSRFIESVDAKDMELSLEATTKTPELFLIERSIEQLLHTAIEELPVVFREVILLREVEEMSYQEIAEALSVPVGTVMSRLARGRNALRSVITKQQMVGQPIGSTGPMVGPQPGFS